MKSESEYGDGPTTSEDDNESDGSEQGCLYLPFEERPERVRELDVHRFKWRMELANRAAYGDMGPTTKPTLEPATEPASKNASESADEPCAKEPSEYESWVVQDQTPEDAFRRINVEYQAERRRHGLTPRSLPRRVAPFSESWTCRRWSVVTSPHATGLSMCGFVHQDYVADFLTCAKCGFARTERTRETMVKDMQEQEEHFQTQRARDRQAQREEVLLPDEVGQRYTEESGPALPTPADGVWNRVAELQQRLLEHSTSGEESDSDSSQDSLRRWWALAAASEPTSEGGAMD
jgi:ribosomal protein L37E